MSEDGVTLEAASPDDAPLLENLLQLYLHDLSDAFPIDLGADGRFRYPNLSRYWSEPDRRFPLLIRAQSRVVGFVLVKRGSPVSDDPNALDVAEFFVLRRYRRAGVGRRAAFLLWDRFRGPWTVRVLEANGGALRFWSGVVGEYTNGAGTAESRDGTPGPWRVFFFDSATAR